jgi:glycosyltransferase involved in cell wall biosynthesis
VSPLRILYLCADPGIPVLGFKGASTHVRALVGALTEAGHTVTVVCTKRGEGNQLATELVEVAPDADVRRLGQLSDLAFARSGLEEKPGSELKRLLHNGPLGEVVTSLCHDLQPDALYERYTLLCNAGARVARVCNVPHVVELNAPLIEERQRYWGLAMPDVARTIEREVFSGADAILAVSAPVRDYAIAGGAPSERVTVLPNAVNPLLFAAERDEAAVAVRTAHNLGGAVVIGFVGSLKPWHGVDLLLEAFANLGDKQLRLLIVGDGPQGEALRLRATAPDLAGRVIFTGQVPHAQIGAYLAAMDIAVAPYRAPGPDQSGFYFSPLKVFEYMAAGCPVVAPYLGQIVDVVEHELHGLLYPPDDTRVLKTHLLRLIRDPAQRAQMGRAGTALVGQQYTWSGNAMRVAELIYQLRAKRSVQCTPQVLP